MDKTQIKDIIQLNNISYQSNKFKTPFKDNLGNFQSSIKKESGFDSFLNTKIKEENEPKVFENLLSSNNVNDKTNSKIECFKSKSRLCLRNKNIQLLRNLNPEDMFEGNIYKVADYEEPTIRAMTAFLTTDHGSEEDTEVCSPANEEEIFMKYNLITMETKPNEEQDGDDIRGQEEVEEDFIDDEDNEEELIKCDDKIKEELRNDPDCSVEMNDKNTCKSSSSSSSNLTFSKLNFVSNLLGFKFFIIIILFMKYVETICSFIYPEIECKLTLYKLIYHK